jgi:hypothetical protein
MPQKSQASDIKDDAAGGLSIGIDSLDEDAVVKRSKFHRCPLTVGKSDRCFGKLFITGPLFANACDQAALFNSLETPALIGWTISVAVF